MRKPHPAIFERALEALEVEPEQALFVGDRLYEDVRGAAEARDDDRAGALVPGRRAPGRRASPTTRRSRSWTSSTSRAGSRRLALETRALVKSCGAWSSAPTIRSWRYASRRRPADRASAPAPGRGRMPPLRASTATRSCIPARASSAACPFVYAYEEFGHTYMGCMHEGLRRSRSTSTCCARPSRGAAASAPCGRRRRRCRCATPRSRRATRAGRDELGCVNPEFHELPVGEPSFRVFAPDRFVAFL